MLPTTSRSFQNIDFGRHLPTYGTLIQDPEYIWDMNTITNTLRTSFFPIYFMNLIKFSGCFVKAITARHVLTNETNSLLYVPLTVLRYDDDDDAVRLFSR